MKGLFSTVNFSLSHLKISTIQIKKENIVPTICFTLCCISIFFTLINTRFARESFFVASYISIIGIIIDRKNILSYLKKIPLALLALGIIKFIWFFTVYFHSPEINFDNASLHAGKRLVLAALIISYLIIKKNDIFNKDKILILALSSTFIFTSLVGLYQVYQGIDRISFINTRATDASYMYSCISLSLILLVLKNENIKTYLATLFIFMISLYLIVQTGTRSTLIFYPVIFIAIVFFNSRFQYKKSILLISILTTSGLFFLSKNSIEAKIEQTKSDLLIYERSNGNEMTSLGSRLAMWQVGLAVFKQHPWGMSLEQRYQYMSDYVRIQNNNESALTYANVHLHNESIETATQQGILGLIILWIFYLTTLFKALSTKNAMQLLILLCLMAYGLTDVILISREQTIYFSLMLLIAYLQTPRQRCKKVRPSIAQSGN